MKNCYVLVLSNTDIEEFRDNLLQKGLYSNDPIIKMDERPNFIDIIKIDNYCIADTKWKHLISVNELPNGDLEILDYVSSFGRTFSNFK